MTASLPAHFRVRSPRPPPRRRSRFFSCVEPSDDEPPARAPPPHHVATAPARIRLEVLDGWQVSVIVLSLYAASFLALLYALLTLRAVRSSWPSHGSTSSLPLPLQLSMPTVPPPAAATATLAVIDCTTRYLLAFAQTLLPLYFVANLVLANNVADEQIWTAVLLAVALVAPNPLTVDQRELRSLSTAIVSDAVYTAVVYVYLLLTVHSYRELRTPRRRHVPGFYLPKLTIGLSYVLVKLAAGFYARVTLGLIPFSRIIVCVKLAALGRAPPRVLLPVLVTTVMDALFAVYLVRQVAITARVLATMPYMETRAKQLGFRCFVYQTLAFCFNIILLSSVINLAIPASYLAAVYDRQHQAVNLEPPVARLGLAFVFFVWNCVLAYVNLPPTPLLLPAALRLARRAVSPLRDTQLAVWLGLSDVVDTQEPEDADDPLLLPQNTPPRQSSAAVRSSLSSASSSTSSQNAPLSLDDKNSIPMRYAHREVFEIVPLKTQRPPHAGSPMSPHCVEEDANPRQRPGPLLRDASASPAVGSPAIAVPRRQRSYRLFPVALWENVDGGPRFGRVEQDEDEDMYVPPVRRRLRLRKNVFVMETQVMMANAAYLSYIPGNPREEIPPLNRGGRKCRVVHPLASDPRSPPEEPSIFFPIFDDDEASSVPWLVEKELHRTEAAAPLETTPLLDDGTSFRVDPYELAQRYGYRVHAYTSCDELNTHAIVLVDDTRVIVAFSGTRDMTNWQINANVNRAVLDDTLTRFEYELDDGAQHVVAHEQIFHEVSVSFNESPDCRAEIEASDDEDHGIEVDIDLEAGYDSDDLCKFRRSISDDHVASRRSSTSAAPLVESRAVASYGSVRQSLRRSRSEYPDDSDLKRGNVRGRGSNASDKALTLRAGAGVQMVASTWAHELLTFGKPKVHSGFINAYLSVRKRVLGALLELYGGRDGGGPCAGLPLFFSGHSMGGALATLGCYEAARYYRRIGVARRQDIACTTFGCPCIGNEAFKMRYERLVETHWRFEMAADPVAKVPTLILNYVPVGVQVLIDQSGMLLVDPSFIEVQWWGQLSNLYMGYRLHVRASYCMALRTYCKLYKGGVDDLDDKFWPFPIRVQTRGLFSHVFGTDW